MSIVALRMCIQMSLCRISTWNSRLQLISGSIYFTQYLRHFISYGVTISSTSRPGVTVPRIGTRIRAVSLITISLPVISVTSRNWETMYFNFQLKQNGVTSIHDLINMELEHILKSRVLKTWNMHWKLEWIFPH